MNQTTSKLTYPLSSPQREIWLDQVLHLEVPLYNIGGYVKIPGVIDPVLFERAVNLLVQKHDTLRTVLTTEQDEDGIQMQTFLEQLEVTVPMQDFSDQADPHGSAMIWMQRRFVEPFELTGQPLFRYDLVKLSTDNYYWLAQYHHLITDGYSIALLNRSLANLYTQLAHGQTPDLMSPSYTCFIEHDHNYSKSDTFEKNRQYWLEKYPSIPEPLLTPYYLARYSDRVIGSGCETLSLPRDFYQYLHTFAKSYGVTFFRVLLGAFYVYFTRIAQQDDLAIGFPILNRSDNQLKAMAGHCSLVNPAWFRCGKDLSFVELLQHIDQTMKDDLYHQPFPMSEIGRMVNQKQGTLRSTLFDISISYQRFDYDTHFYGIKTQTTWLLHHWGQTPLHIYIQDFHAQGNVRFDFVYNHVYFTAENIKALQDRLVIILEAILKQADVPIHKLPVMTAQETQQLLAWNQTETHYPHDKTIVELFQAQVERTPENIAVVFEDQQLSYQQLNTQANQLAQLLREKGIERGKYVPVFMTRGLEVPIAFLAIMKSGAAFVPIDIRWPKTRLEKILNQLKSPIVLVNHGISTLPTLSYQEVVVVKASTREGGMPNIQIQISADDPIYVIYTSGSTGEPKGAINHHRGIINRFWYMNKIFGTLETDVILQTTPHHFDSAVWQLFWPLMSGAHTVIPSDHMSFEPKLLLELISKEKVTITDWVPAILDRVVELFSTDDISRQAFSLLRQIVVGGETIHSETIRQLKVNFPHLGITNAYGPTETSIGVIFYEVPIPTPISIPIGKPIANVKALILDNHLNLLPIGVPGELYLGGVCVGLGYLNNETETKARFLKNPLPLFESDRLYKTGDLARYLPDGNIEYLGRIDHQVKLRGFRIELGEIEANLSQHPAIKEAVVTVREDFSGDKRLVGYVVLHSGFNETSSQLRQFLKEKLPEYMVPSTIVFLEALPLTPNGKIDRRALPKPEHIETEETFVAPRNEVELQLQRLWEEVLQIRPIGMTHNFFEVGGHSLLAVKLLNHIEKSFGQGCLSLITLFQSPTIAQQAKILSHEGYLVQWRTLEIIQSQGSLPPLLFFSPTEYILSLTASLGTDQPIYKLNPLGLLGLYKEISSLDQVAQQYIEEIKMIQPDGPYYLIGFCGQKKVVLETAKQLQIQGSQVAFLGLIQAIPYYPPCSLVHHWSKLRKTGLGYIKQKIQKKLRFLSTSLSSSRSREVAWANAKFYNKASDQQSLNELEYKQFVDSFFNTISHHIPSIYHGDITLFYQSEACSRLSVEIELAQSVAAGKMEICEVPAKYNESLFVSPQAEILGRQLKQCLEGARMLHRS